MKLTTLISQHKWTIGFSFEGTDALINNNELNVKWVKNPYRDRWFADPFILNVTDSSIEVLVEEFYYTIFRGRISKLLIDRDSMTIKESCPILQLDTHLSFPYIDRRKDGIYIIPENYESGTCKEYKYNPVNNECTFTRTLVNSPLTDAVYTNILDGDNLLISTCYPNHTILHIYKEKESVFSEISCLPFESNIARNAGSWFKYGERIFRPAQDCNDSYGRAIILQEVCINGNKIAMINHRRIESTNPSYQLGCHTLNIYNDILVFDAKSYRYPFLNTLYRLARKILLK